MATKNDAAKALETLDGICPYAQENRVFSSFAEHQQDLEDAVNLLIEARVKGENCSIQFETEVSDEDIAWVMAEVERRLANARIH